MRFPRRELQAISLSMSSCQLSRPYCLDGSSIMSITRLRAMGEEYLVKEILAKTFIYDERLHLDFVSLRDGENFGSRKPERTPDYCNTGSMADLNQGARGV